VTPDSDYAAVDAEAKLEDLLPPWELPSSERAALVVPEERRCAHVRSSGTRCKNLPLRGTDTCAWHTPLPERRNAQLRMLLLLDPAFETLYLAMGHGCEMAVVGKTVYCKTHGLECPDWSTRANAAKTVLDRCGFGPKATVAVEAPQHEFSGYSDDQLAAEMEGVAEELRIRAAGHAATPAAAAAKAARLAAEIAAQGNEAPTFKANGAHVKHADEDTLQVIDIAAADQ
jgi:hypothetical protein